MWQLSGLRVACLVLFVHLTAGAKLGSSPLGKALELIDQLRDAVVEDGVRQEEAYRKYKNWCENQNAELNREVDESKKAADRIAAEIQEAEASIAASGTVIEKLASQVAQDEAKLKSVQDVRDQEKADFKASEKSLVDAIEALDKAGEVLAEELKKDHSGAVLLQEGGATAAEMNQVSEVLMGLAAVVDSAGLQARSATQLAALLQSRAQQGDESAAAPAAPEADFYTSHSQDLVDLIKKMQDEAEENLQGLREKEAEAKNDHEQIASALQRQMTGAQDNIDTEKKSQQSSAVEKSKLEGDKQAAVDEAAAVQESIKAAQESCMQSSVDEERARDGRQKEIQTLEEAHRVIVQSTGFKEGPTVNLLQLSATSGAAAGATKRRMAEKSPLEQADEFLHGRQAPLAKAAAQAATSDDVASVAEQLGSERGGLVLGLLRRMAKEQHSPVLAQLTTKISAAVKAVGGEDPLKAVRKMVQDMILKMEEQASAEMQEHAYCQAEMSRSEARIKLLNDNIRTAGTEIDAAASNSAILKADVTTLKEELTRLGEEQVEMTSNAEEMKKNYQLAKADLEKGLDGIRAAMDALKVYYGSQEESFVQLSQPAAGQEIYTSRRVSLLQGTQQSAQSKAVALMAASMGMDSPASLEQTTGDEAPDADPIIPAEPVAAIQEDEAESDVGSQAARAIAALQESSAASEPPPAPVPHKANIEAGSTVVAILEVCEQEFADNMAELDTQAADQERQQAELLKQNQILQQQHQLSIKYKTKEFEGFDEEVRKLTADLEAAKRELKPLEEYYGQVQERCIKKVTREENMARRQQEIEGLREALAVLEGDAGLLQLSSGSTSFLQKRASHAGSALQP
eukprot:gb/GFBE01033546.1/.p1 GENE.gb/GFBE01033546.1/~~gb/GFBE01033546.1/.p1  ORF type:complete len:857 (+),score=314.14 gb/GFBE01033546.1/:1-2571(+)